MKVSRAETVRKYGTEIDRIIRTIRKWMTESDQPPSAEEILTKCEDEFFGSEASLRTNSHETVIIIESLRTRLSGKYGILTGLLEDPLINEIMVNGPDYHPDNVIIFRSSSRFTVIDLISAYLIHIPYELVQTFKARSAEILRFGKQHLKIRHPLRAFAHAQNMIGIFVVDEFGQ